MSQIFTIWFFPLVFVFGSVFFVFVIWWLIRHGRAIAKVFLSIGKSIVVAVKKNPEVKKINNRYPRIIHFFQNCFNKKHFFGWPMTWLIIVLFFLLLHLFGVTQSVLDSGLVVGADIRIAQLMAVFRSAQFTNIFLWVTLLGSWQLIVAGGLVVGLVLWARGRKIYIGALYLGLLACSVTVYLGKIMIHRDRSLLSFYDESSFSFPSGHAAMSMMLYGFVAYALLKYLRSKKMQSLALLAGICVVGLVGFSRIYLCVHYISDVWAGYILGLFWLISSIGLVSYLKSKNLPQWLEHKKMHPKSKQTARILLAIYLVAYIGIGLQYDPHLTVAEHVLARMVAAENIPSLFPESLPQFSETLTGMAQEPLSFVVITKDMNGLLSAMKSAGWYTADTVTPATTWQALKSAIKNESYVSAPMTPSFWNAQVHSVGFEQPTETQTFRQRHHTRFWDTGYETAFGEKIFVATASLDQGIKWGITHAINPDIDTEREFLFSSLQSAGRIISSEKIQFIAPRLGTNFAGDPFFTDGKVYVLHLVAESSS
ncbi:MAG: LssY C-terminal domain-containing protein [Candidatus Magasanikbacteria bacterium]